MVTIRLSQSTLTSYIRPVISSFDVGTRMATRGQGVSALSPRNRCHYGQCYSNRTSIYSLDNSWILKCRTRLDFLISLATMKTEMSTQGVGLLCQRGANPQLHYLELAWRFRLKSTAIFNFNSIPGRSNKLSHNKRSKIADPTSGGRHLIWQFLLSVNARHKGFVQAWCAPRTFLPFTTMSIPSIVET